MNNKFDLGHFKSKIESFCKKHYIRKLSLFGSLLHENFGPDSDIDFLVEFDKEHKPGLIKLSGMEIELSEIIGHKVDLRTQGDLSRYFREEVIDEAELQYQEG
ncbi:nucleotidyltransferase domain-containing protein [bacterium]|nr:nucleotidyltransferase domain-containing protein [bacterium]